MSRKHARKINHQNIELTEFSSTKKSRIITD
jgi:hypothetical protein